MAAYVIMDVKVKDAAGYDEYRRAGSPSVPQYGGKYIVRGGRVDVLEGESPPNRIIVIEFATFDQAKRWYDSPEYQAALKGRLRTADSKVLIVEGVLS
jgi:uncharacterized protein (DUF1330 family)